MGRAPPIVSDWRIADEHLKDRASREAYAKRIGALDTGYLDTLAYTRVVNLGAGGLTDSEAIDLLELPWEKHPDG